MIADYADKLNTYEEFKDYADMVQQFIKNRKRRTFQEGRYDLKTAFCLGSRNIPLSHWKVHRWNP